MCGGKTHYKRKTAYLAVFQEHRGGVLEGIECSPKIFDFKSERNPLQERVDFFATLAWVARGNPFLFFCFLVSHIFSVHIGPLLSGAPERVLFAVFVNVGVMPGH